MAKGEWEAGVRHLEEHIRNAQNLGDFRWLHSVHILFAERDFLEGRPDSARNRIEQLRALPGLSEDALLEVLPTLARASMEMGDVDGAERIAAGAVQRARDEDARMTLAEALRAHGAVLAAQGRHDEAEERFRESLSLSGSMPCPYAAARTLYDYGAMLVRQGRREEGKERLGAALGVFQRLGARPYAERTEQELMKVPIP
jgi:tetratricopeptide (TPR) repeat protein